MTTSTPLPEQWAIKQHIEKYPKCEWLCTHTNLKNLGEQKDEVPLPEQGDFNERLTEILTKLDLGEYLGEGGVDAARTAIRILVLEEIIGTDEQVIEGSYSGTTEFVSTEISKPIRNHLRAEQRKKLEDNHDTK